MRLPRKRVEDQEPSAERSRLPKALPFPVVDTTSEPCRRTRNFLDPDPWFGMVPRGCTLPYNRRKTYTPPSPSRQRKTAHSTKLLSQSGSVPSPPPCFEEAPAKAGRPSFLSKDLSAAPADTREFPTTSRRTGSCKQPPDVHDALFFSHNGIRNKTKADSIRGTGAKSQGQYFICFDEGFVSLSMKK